jgi:hypothetical protein
VPQKRREEICGYHNLQYGDRRHQS